MQQESFVIPEVKQSFEFTDNSSPNEDNEAEFDLFAPGFN